MAEVGKYANICTPAQSTEKILGHDDGRDLHVMGEFNGVPIYNGEYRPGYGPGYGPGHDAEHPGYGPVCDEPADVHEKAVAHTETGTKQEVPNALKRGGWHGPGSHGPGP